MAEKKTVLFIDDNPVDRALINKLLEKNGFSVLLAEDGIKGYKMALDGKMDVILLDILLPGMSGIDLCKTLKKSPATLNVPIIFYTSLDTPKEFIDYASYGAIDYIQKTTPTEELISAIKAVA